jgi:hypothetical protein
MHLFALRTATSRCNFRLTSAAFFRSVARVIAAVVAAIRL